MPVTLGFGSGNSLAWDGYPEGIRSGWLPFQDFFVQLFVFFRVTDVDAGAQYPDGAAIGGQRALMSNGVDPPRQAAENRQAARGQIAPQAFRHLRAIKCWPARPYDAEAREIEDLRVAAQIEQHRRIVDLQQGLGIFQLGPVDEAIAGNVANRRQLFLGALEGVRY
jgi:hypothetical protein